MHWSLCMLWPTIAAFFPRQAFQMVSGTLCLHPINEAEILVILGTATPVVCISIACVKRRSLQFHSVLGWASGLRYSDLLPLCRCPSVPQLHPPIFTQFTRGTSRLSSCIMSYIQLLRAKDANRDANQGQKWHMLHRRRSWNWHIP